MKYAVGASVLLAVIGGGGVREIHHGSAAEAPTPGPAPATGGPPGTTTTPAPTPTPAGPSPAEPILAEAGAPAGRADGGAVQPPPGGGGGVTINGVFVPRARAVVILHIGHSNMAGRATGPGELKPYFYDTDPHLWTYGKGQFQPAREPTAPDNEAGQAAGPGMALLRSALAAGPPDTFVVSIGHGHSGSFGGTCSAFRKGGLLYDVAMKPALELKGRVTYAGVFTMFGQSEHNAPANQQRAFLDCLSGMAAEMRGDLGEPELPFVVGDYEAGITRAGIEPTSAFARPIIAQLQMVPAKIPRSALIPTTGLPMED